MDGTVRLRSTGMRNVGAVTVGFATLLAGGLLLAGDWSGLALWAGPLGLLALVGVAGFWLPYVEVSDGYVELRNVLRTVRLPWPAIREVEGRYGLVLDTAYGRVGAWAAPAPSGRDRIRGGDSDTAAEVRRRLQPLRAAGHLDDPRLESESLPARWHGEVLVAAGVLLVLTFLGTWLA